MTKTLPLTDVHSFTEERKVCGIEFGIIEVFNNFESQLYKHVHKVWLEKVCSGTRAQGQGTSIKDGISH
jgi:hypothetical protein